MQGNVDVGFLADVSTSTAGWPGACLLERCLGPALQLLGSRVTTGAAAPILLEGPRAGPCPAPQCEIATGSWPSGHAARPALLVGWRAQPAAGHCPLDSLPRGRAGAEPGFPESQRDTGPCFLCSGSMAHQLSGPVGQSTPGARPFATASRGAGADGCPGAGGPAAIVFGEKVSAWGFVLLRSIKKCQVQPVLAPAPGACSTERPGQSPRACPPHCGVAQGRAP